MKKCTQKIWVDALKSKDHGDPIGASSMSSEIILNSSLDCCLPITNYLSKMTKTQIKMITETKI